VHVAVASDVRAVCQRVRFARVVVEGKVVGEIGAGWAILVGVGEEDLDADATVLADKIVGLRAFEDNRGKMGLAAADVGADFLVISQITLHADTSKGRRPSFNAAARPESARRLVDYFAQLIRDRGFRVATGQFGAMMDLELCNHGPVTMVLSSRDW
jgi:D-tyrosyl-tRNA(Tyr) deacylase